MRAIFHNSILNLSSAMSDSAIRVDSLSKRYPAVSPGACPFAALRAAPLWGRAGSEHREEACHIGRAQQRHDMSSGALMSEIRCQETGVRCQETGIRRQEAGVRRHEAAVGGSGGTDP